MSNQDEVQIGIRISKTLKQIIEAHVRRDTHINLSDFCREAIRAKLMDEAPDLYKQIVKQNGKKNTGEASSRTPPEISGSSARGFDRRSRQ